MEELLTEVAKSIRTSRTAPDSIDLPLFRPETDDATRWTQQVEQIKDEFELSDLQVLVRVGRFLLQDAKIWFENWFPTTRDWNTFKGDFLEAFPPRKILGRLLCEASICNSDDFNTYSTYVHTKLALLKGLRAQWGTTDLIELIIYGIRDAKVQESATMRDFTSISDLIAYLSSISKQPGANIMASTSSESATGIPQKRARYDNAPLSKLKPTCFKCGRIGHVQRHCRSLLRQKSQRSNNDDGITNSASPAKFKNSFYEQTSATVAKKCNFCCKTGHVENNCFLKKAIDNRRHVNFTNTASPKTVVPSTIKINREIYLGIIDTGADISLISDKFLDRFKTQVVEHNQSITGITAGSIVSKYKVEAEVEITGQRTTLWFMFVPARTLDYDVIVGCNLFRDETLAAVTDIQGTQIVKR